ncbi:hypothetical protein, partial [Acinetobacter oleivorans]
IYMEKLNEYHPPIFTKNDLLKPS